MYFVALATDYDGTIAEDGVVAEATLEALRELKQSGRKLLLVTARLLPALKKVLPGIALFDLVVAENGGILFDTKTNEEMGFAARFASGYLAVALDHPEEPISGSARRSTHAWAQIYLPGPGWDRFRPHERQRSREAALDAGGRGGAELCNAEREAQGERNIRLMVGLFARRVRWSRAACRSPAVS